MNKSTGSFNIKSIYENLELSMNTANPRTHYVLSKSHIYQKAGSTITSGNAYLSRSGEMMLSFGDKNGERYERKFVF